MATAAPDTSRRDRQATAATDEAAVPSLDRATRRRVAWFGAALLGAGAIIFVLAVLPLPPRPSHAFGLPDLGLIGWLLVTAGFYAAESKNVAITVQREQTVFSLIEIPLVVGLFLLSPVEMVVAFVLGRSLVMVIVQQQHRQLMKFSVNLGSYLLAGTVAVVVFAGTVAPQPLLIAPRTWLSALGATLATSIITYGAIATAFFLIRHKLHGAELVRDAVVALVVSASAAAIALIGVTLMAQTPAAALLMAVPIVAAYLAFHAYSSERRQHEAYETLYRSQKVLRETPEIGASMRNLLAQVKTTFRSEVAEITLFPSDSRDVLLRTSLEPDVGAQELVPVEDPDREAALLDHVGGGANTIVRPGTSAGVELHQYAAGRGLREAMIVPLRGETRVVGALLVANRSGQVSMYRNDELHLLETLASNAIPSLEAPEVDRTLAELHALKEQLRRQAYHDALTGVATRAVLDDRLDAALEGATRPGEVALLYLDVVEFRNINTLLGSDAGDQILVEIAERMLRCVRPGDLVARVGADTFAVLIEHVTEPELPVNVAERIGFSMRPPFAVAGRDVNLRVSVGIAVSDGTDELVGNAEIAMEQSRQDFGRRYAMFEPDMRAIIGARIELREALAEAVRRDQFVVAYQPIIALDAEELVGFEALVRWHHPQRGVVPPNEFIPVAEESELIVAIGRRVLGTATRQLAQWRLERPDLMMSVNLSAREFADEGLLTSVEAAIHDSGIPADSLVLEMTERDLMDDTGSFGHRLDALKSVGVKLAIDDFGTGYSSLSYLPRFPVDILKVAKDFVDDIGTDDGGVLAKAIIDLGHALGLEIIAEGIETAGQRDLLVDWGCAQGQGWLFAKALAPEEIELSRGAPPFWTSGN